MAEGEIVVNPQDPDDERQPLVQAEEKRPPRLMLGLLAGTAFFDGADTTLLSACFLALERDLGLRPMELGQLLLCQSLAAACMAPVWAILCDRGLLSRKSALVLGTVGWTVSTALLAACDRMQFMIPLRIANGAMLAILLPVSQGLIAETTSDQLRGRYFGTVEMAGNFGRFGAMLVAPPLSMMTLGGMHGWRVVFLGFAALSALICALLQLFFVEPNPVAKANPTSVTEEIAHLARYFRIPTFALTVVQGLFGSAPWNALGFLAMYFQLSGISDWQSSMLVASSIFCIGLGALVGGFIGDWMAQKFGHAGRPLTGQISIFSTIPFCFLIFFGIKAGPDTVGVLLVCLCLVGFTSAWTMAGAKRPILSEIVEAEDRATVIAWDTAWEGASAALFGAPLVALLAEGLFKYPLPKLPGSHAVKEVADPGKAEALGKALLCATAGPWFVCLILFSFIHWTYPRDVQRLAELRAAREAGEAHRRV